MARKRVIRSGGDVREHPRYSIAEAAEYLRVPRRTLHAWTRGQRYTTRSGKRVVFHPLIELADPANKLLSFNNLAEAHVLRFTRQKKVPLKRVRMALQYVRETWPSRHPLLSREFEVYGQSVFIKHLGKTINASRYGQFAMRKLLGKYLERMKRDGNGDPLEIYPIETRRLAINPLICSGRPIVKDTGISAAILRDRLASGESDAEVARDYGLTIREVKQAVNELAAV